MRSFLLRNILAPVTARVGAIVAGLLAAHAVDPETANQIMVGLGAVFALGIDLLSRKFLIKEAD